MATKLFLGASNSRIAMILRSSTVNLQICKFSSANRKSDSNNEKITIRKSVFISQSYDIFTNLALEDWIYRNYDFTSHHVLMLWMNNPCVVVGRHQNPFSETNVSNLKSSGIQLARRNSGGGTVFHDLGNLNCTFFTPRDRYDRKYNLNLMTRAIYREYGIDTEISDRDDILLGGKKVSSLFLRSEAFVFNLDFINQQWKFPTAAITILPKLKITLLSHTQWHRTQNMCINCV